MTRTIIHDTSDARCIARVRDDGEDGWRMLDLKVELYEHGLHTVTYHASGDLAERLAAEWGDGLDDAIDQVAGQGSPPFSVRPQA